MKFTANGNEKFPIYPGMEAKYPSLYHLKCPLDNDAETVKTFSRYIVFDLIISLSVFLCGDAPLDIFFGGVVFWPRVVWFLVPRRSEVVVMRNKLFRGHKRSFQRSCVLEQHLIV